jgi:hypothetical protein
VTAVNSLDEEQTSGSTEYPRRTMHSVMEFEPGREVHGVGDESHKKFDCDWAGLGWTSRLTKSGGEPIIIGTVKVL